MKKIILAAILLAAAGGAVYLFTQRNQNIEPPLGISYKETIIGDWKIDSITSNDNNGIGLLFLSLDSNLTNYTFRFAEDGAIILEGDSLIDKELMQVVTLTTNQLDLRSADSAVIHFRKKK